MTTVHQVIHRRVIATAKAFAVVGPRAVRNMWMTILIAVVDVWSAMVVVVFARAFDAIVKTLALDIAKLLRGSIPCAVLIITRSLRVGLSNDVSRCCQSHSEY